MAENGHSDESDPLFPPLQLFPSADPGSSLIKRFKSTRFESASKQVVFAIHWIQEEVLPNTSDLSKTLPTYRLRPDFLENKLTFVNRLLATCISLIWQRQHYLAALRSNFDIGGTYLIRSLTVLLVKLVKFVKSEGRRIQWVEIPRKAPRFKHIEMSAKVWQWQI